MAWLDGSQATEASPYGPGALLSNGGLGVSLGCRTGGRWWKEGTLIAWQALQCLSFQECPPCTRIQADSLGWVPIS